MGRLGRRGCAALRRCRYGGYGWPYYDLSYGYGLPLLYAGDFGHWRSPRFFAHRHHRRVYGMLG